MSCFQTLLSQAPHFLSCQGALQGDKGTCHVGVPHTVLNQLLSGRVQTGIQPRLTPVPTTPLLAALSLLKPNLIREPSAPVFIPAASY